MHERGERERGERWKEGERERGTDIKRQRGREGET